ncbi:hypothetical protein E2C01_048593 [Portunus trituberculatus]|uniref:Uncharacterized protein n=1 Tax=Portunus trituberculatus TaxID=210409 RepID=A0A5B7GAL9_PORTR|nr:hypothetical protein [Portunus trituberculatus]
MTVLRPAAVQCVHMTRRRAALHEVQVQDCHPEKRGCCKGLSSLHNTAQHLQQRLPLFAPSRVQQAVYRAQ